jgi:hypothetical protein
MFLIFINLILLTLFIKGYYLLYFLILVAVVFLVNKKYLSVNIVVMLFILFTPFLVNYFDEYIYDMLIDFSLDEYYFTLKSVVSDILAFMHTFIFFLSYNRKNYLTG